MHFNEAFDPFRALKSSWTILKQAPAAVLVGGLLLWICESGPGLAQVDLEEQDGLVLDVPPAELARGIWEHVAPALAGAIGVFVCILLLAGFLFGSLVRVGFARAVERALVEGVDEIGDLFESRGRWLSMVLVQILTAVLFVLIALPAGIGIALAMLALRQVDAGDNFSSAAAIIVALAYAPVAVYFWLGISLAPTAVACEGLGPAEAVARSWDLVRGHRLTLLLYIIVIYLVAALVTCCSCCCLFFGGSVVEHTAFNDSYLRLVNSGDPETWASQPAKPA